MGVSDGPGESGHGVNLVWNWNSSNGRRSEVWGVFQCVTTGSGGVRRVFWRVPDNMVKPGEGSVWFWSSEREGSENTRSGVHSETQQTVTLGTAAGHVLVWSLAVLRSFYFSKASVEKEKKLPVCVLYSTMW